MLRIKTPGSSRVVLTPSKITGVILFLLGLTILLLAMYYSVSVPALIGLGLTFWGIILTYVQSEEYVSKKVLDATAASLMAALAETIQELDFKGKAVYLPPKYLTDPESVKVYIPKNESDQLPTPTQTQKLETQPYSRNRQGMLVNPPGAALTKLFEKNLGTSFNRTSIDDLPQMLPKLLIEKLEIATDLKIELSPRKYQNPDTQPLTDQNTVKVSLTTATYRDTCKQAKDYPAVYSNIGCPLTSSIASVITKATGRPVMISNQETSDDGETVETHYTILEGEGQ